MSDIVERLRNRQAKWDNAVRGWIEYTLDDHALDEEVAAEIDRLKEICRDIADVCNTHPSLYTRPSDAIHKIEELAIKGYAP